jgi:hypothetical protein
VLADVDATLADWLSAALPAGTELDFAPPADLAERRRGRGARMVNLFLHDVRADPAGLAAAEVYLRDEQGRVRGVQSPLRRYRLDYLVTAWAEDVRAEHRLLGQVLAAPGGGDALAGDALRGELRELNLPLPVELCGQDEPVFWAALGLPARTALRLTVTAPVPPVVRLDVAPPVQRVGVAATQLPGVTR